MTTRFLVLIAALSIAGGACSSDTGNFVFDAPTPISHEALMNRIVTSERPTVVNSWAAWCPPCRSEAPLFVAAASGNPEVDVIMLNTNDNPDKAVEFIAASLLSAPLIHYADPDGSVTSRMGGGSGLPVTFFYYAGGELAHIHFGLIDEPTIALYLDEIQQ